MYSQLGFQAAVFAFASRFLFIRRPSARSPKWTAKAIPCPMESESAARMAMTGLCLSKSTAVRIFRSLILKLFSKSGITIPSIALAPPKAAAAMAGSDAAIVSVRSRSSTLILFWRLPAASAARGKNCRTNSRVSFGSGTASASALCFRSGFAPVPGPDGLSFFFFTGNTRMRRGPIRIRI